MKNPLGIIALFVTLIESVAGLVISVNFASFHGGWERLPLIWFIVLFPLIVLGIFLYLVIKHPEKLYGPKDFDDQKLYLQAMEKNIRPHKEPEKLEKPEEMTLERNKNSVCLFSYSDLKTNHRYYKIQEAALQRYSDEHNLEIKTQVHASYNYFCDGIAEKDGEVYLFDVKINYTPSMSEKIKSNLVDISKNMAIKKCNNITVVLILVTMKKIQSDMIHRLLKQLSGIKPKLEVLNYESDDLDKN